MTICITFVHVHTARSAHDLSVATQICLVQKAGTKDIMRVIVVQQEKSQRIPGFREQNKMQRYDQHKCAISKLALGSVDPVIELDWTKGPSVEQLVEHI